jgi:hypothetical protein
MVFQLPKRERRVSEGVDKQLVELYATSDVYTHVLDIFPAPKLGGLSRQPDMTKYATKLRASTPTSSDTAPTGGGHTHHRQTRPRRTAEIKIIYDPTDSLFPPLPITSRKSYPTKTN